MLEMVPHLLAGIPVRGAWRKVKYMQPGLAVHKTSCLLGRVGKRVIHEDFLGNSRPQSFVLPTAGPFEYAPGRYNDFLRWHPHAEDNFRPGLAH